MPYEDNPNLNRDLMIDKLNQHTAASEFILKSKTNTIHRIVPGWNDYLKMVIKNRSAAAKEFRATRLETDLALFQLKRSQARKLIQISKNSLNQL